MTEQPHEAPLPRRVYFGAADKQHLAEKKISGGATIHEIEVGRRNKLALNVSQRAEDVVGAVKALRSFDGTGNTEDALNHLQAALQDLTKAHAILVDDVTDSLARYRDRRENVQVIAEVAASKPRAYGMEGLGEIRVDILPDFSAVTSAAASVLAAAPKPGPRA